MRYWKTCLTCTSTVCPDRNSGLLPDFVNLALVNTESLYRQLTSPLNQYDHTYRSDPFLASTLDTGPVKVSNLGSAFLIRTNDLASDITILENRFHPSQLHGQKKF
jgi:hypothetical protein